MNEMFNFIIELQPVLSQWVKVAGLNEELDARQVAFGGRKVQGGPPVVVLGLHVLVGVVEPVI